MKASLLRLLIGFACVGVPGFGRVQYAVLVGPMFHLKFSGQGTKKSFGLETSFWRFTDKGRVAAGADVGWEHEFGGPARFYAELQSSTIGVANETPYVLGASLGTVFEAGNSTHPFGLQATLWGPHPLLMGDLRFRSGNGLVNGLGVGMFAKIPVYFNHATEMLRL